MNDFFESIIKGLEDWIPEDEPIIKSFQLQNEIKKRKAQENELYLTVGKRVLDEEGDAYQEEQEQLKEIRTAREEAEQELLHIQSGKGKKEDPPSEDMEDEGAQGESYDGRVCANCKTVNPADNQFCKECGVRIPEEDSRICLGCGSFVEEEAKFCGKCGRKVNE